MKISKILNVVLAVAVLFLIVLVVVDVQDEAVMDNIATRTSIRSYTDQPVEEEKIEQMLKAAMAAPSAVNKQPWAFVVVRDKNLLKTLADSLPNAKMTATAPLAIVVCGDLTKALKGEAQDFWIQDASAATQNLLLTAHALELGAVWTGVWPSVARATIVRSILNMPEAIVPLCVVPIGYPAENPEPKDKWNTSNIHYDMW